MVIRWIRTRVYNLGFRPKPGSIFYSPTIALNLSMENVVRDAFRKALMPCKDANSNVCVAEGCFGETCLTLQNRK